MSILTSLTEKMSNFGTLVIDRQKLNEQIAEMIQQQITNGTLKPGDRLPPERELATLLKVNRATVRESIHLLSERGLVERKNGRGTRIMAMRPWNVGAAINRFFVSNNCSQRELHEFRSIFEPKVAAFAATNARAEDIKKLNAVLSALEEAWIAQDIERLASTDAQFHLALAAASHNTLMLAVASGLNIVLERSMKMSHASAHSEESFQTHRMILSGGSPPRSGKGGKGHDATVRNTGDLRSENLRQAIKSPMTRVGWESCLSPLVRQSVQHFLIILLISDWW